MMKKTLLLTGLLAGALYANAQQRLVLYEEFSGENCAPCAATNPGLWTLLTTGTNPNKVMLIKYQSPIPTAGPIYYQNTGDVQNRMNYYTVPFAPYARMDGTVSPGPNEGHPGDLTQAFLDAATSIASPFNITVSNSVTGTTLNSTINVSAVAAYSGTAVKLRAALVETLIYTSPPGTNGETEFHHVVRKMYPTADGQTIPNTWTNGQTGTYTFSGQIPSYVDRTHELFVVVWIQNDDANKKVAQTAKSVNLPLPAADGAITASSPVNGSLFCTAGAQSHKVTLKNTGTSAMTSADIYYKVGAGAFQMFAWTGSLAPNATTEVTLGNITLSNGTNAIVDSIGKVNTQSEVNPANSVYNSALVGYATPSALPLASSFESGLSAGWAILDNANKAVSNPTFRGETWATFSDGDIHAYDGTWTAVVSNADMTTGNKTTLILPLANIAAGPKALDFYYCNAMRTTIGDKLEIVSSTDCGQNWTPIWTKANADLANNPPTAANALIVPSSNANYRFVSVDMSALTANALIGFRSTSGGGNYIWLDKVNMRTGAVSGIEELISGGNASLYPNPAMDQVTVELNMVKATKVTFQVVNMLGQQVGQSVVKTLNAGQTNTVIATNDLAPGMYFMNIVTDKGNLQQKFVKK